MNGCVVVLLIFAFFSDLNAATFHAIITADTATSNIKHSATQDLLHMSKAVSHIAKQIQTPHTLSTLQANSLTLSKLQKKIRKLKVGPDDTIFFYFSGHGFGSRSGKTRWPMMHFKPKNEDICLDKIEKALLKKKARLLILLCDSCNDVQRSHGRAHQSVTYFFGEPEVDPALEAIVFKKLFLQTKGTIIASGSVPGELAYGTKFGGWFTFAFLRALELEPLQDAPSWKHVGQELISQLANCSQRPQIKLSLQ